MTEQEIYVLMAKTPDIRAVQIADALDQEVDDVVTAMGPLIRCGNVSQKDGRSPNGFPALQYNLTDKFRKSPQFRPIAIVLAAQKAAAVTRAATASFTAPISKHVAADGEQVVRQQTSAGAEVTIRSAPAAARRPAVAPEVSRAAIGIAFVTDIKRPVSNQEMRQAMGLTKAQAPSGWLGAAIRNGKLHKDGDMWLAGPRPAELAPIPAPGAKATAAAAVKSVVVGDVFVAARGAEALDTAVASITGAAAPAQLPVFRCGFWSDGVLELQRDGSTIAQLERREGEQLVGFFQRMLATAVPVQTSAQMGQD